MQTTQALAAFDGTADAAGSIPPADPVRNLDIATLYQASDRLLAMWIALTLTKDDHYLVADVEYVMRLVRSVTAHCETVQSSARRVSLTPSVPRGPARIRSTS